MLTGIRGPHRRGRRLGGDARDALAVLRAVRERLPGVVASVSTDLDASSWPRAVIVRFGSDRRSGRQDHAVKTVLADVDTAAWRCSMCEFREVRP